MIIPVIENSKAVRISRLELAGFRCFQDLKLSLRPLQVFVGANGSGKSSFFEFARFLRDGMSQDIPTEIVPGAVGQSVFYMPGEQKFRWTIEFTGAFQTDNFGTQTDIPVVFSGEVTGPKGEPAVTYERIETSRPISARYLQSFLFMDIERGRGVIQMPPEGLKKQEVAVSRPTQFSLGRLSDPTHRTLVSLRDAIESWRFYNAKEVDTKSIRLPVPIQQGPYLWENAGNLSAVLHYLMTEQRGCFEALEAQLKAVIPGFRQLSVKARGGSGEVIAFWREEGERELTLADLSEGTLRLICWLALCVHPSPPSLVCIDEPDSGLHPRGIAVLAGMLQKLASRTQVFLSTHSSYFLSQFDLDSIVVLRKKLGASVAALPATSKTLVQNLEEFGSEELEKLHRSDELERFA